MVILSQQFLVQFDVWPGKRWTTVAGVSSASFLTVELPVSKVGFLKEIIGTDSLKLVKVLSDKELN